jgi:hypothetical protein
MPSQPYIPGVSPAEPAPLARFLPPIEEGLAAAWLSQTAPGGSWILDPFGIAPRLPLEAAHAGYRVIVTANNPITRFLLEMEAHPPTEADFKGGLADLASSKKGSDRLELHLQSLYQTRCESCGSGIQAQAFLWRRSERAPYARIYACPHCGDQGERPATPDDVERAQGLAAADGLHRARTLERVAALDQADRLFAEDAIQHYLPRPLYVLTTIINRLDGLSLSPERHRALTALILVACDDGNTLWGHPYDRARPRQLHIPAQFRENNLWLALDGALNFWQQPASGVPLETWPNPVPESGGICIFEGRLRDLAHAVRKEIPIRAAIGCLPRPNQAFWTLSALWAGWLWGRQAVEPFKIALARRRYDWTWSATALHAASTHLFGLLPLGTPFFGLLPEPEPQFLTSALTAANAAGFDMHSLALRTQHDAVQIVWQRGENLRREAHSPEMNAVRETLQAYLVERGEPASYLHMHAVGLLELNRSHSLMPVEGEFDEAMRGTQSVLRLALGDEGRFIHYSTGESLETGLWGLHPDVVLRQEARALVDSLADRLEVVVSALLQSKPRLTPREIETDVYARFPGLLAPSRSMLAAVLSSYAEYTDGFWVLRPEDRTAARSAEIRSILADLESIGRRLDYSIRRQGNLVLWEQRGAQPRAFLVMASARIGRAIAEATLPPDQLAIVIPGGRAALAAYTAQRDPFLAERTRPFRLVKYRLMRALSEMSILTRETFAEQLASDPVEQARGQLMMF